MTTQWYSSRPSRSSSPRAPGHVGPQATDRRHLPGLRRPLLQAPQRPAEEARLQESPRLLQEGPGSGAQARETRGGRVARGAVPAGVEATAAGDRALPEVHQGPSRLAAGRGGPLPAGGEPVGRGASQARPANLAGPAGPVRRLEVGADRRGQLQALADVGDPAGRGRSSDGQQQRAPSAASATGGGAAVQPVAGAISP